MVSDSELISRLREILQSSDLETTTAGSVRRQLEKDFGVDLTEKKGFISGQIDVYFETLQNEEENEEEIGNDVIEDEAEEEGAEDKMGRSNEEEKVVKKKRGGGFSKLCSLSPQLQNFLGVPELARTEVVKRIWAYIREHDLQDPKNKRNIKCDEALHAVFRVNTINMFQMNKALSKHIWPLTAKDENVELKVEDESIISNGLLSEKDDTNEDKEVCKVNEEGEEAEEEVEAEEKNKEEEKEEEEEGEEEEVVTQKQQSKRKKKGRCTEVDKEVKRRGGGFTKICSLSEQLQEFVGVPQLARTEVVKKLWAYIREHNLQDPKDKRNILCDDSLHALFRVNSINMFQMNKHLSKHIWPLDEEAAPENSSQKERQSKHAREEGPDEPKQKEKQQKKGTFGLQTPLPLSEALVKFIGTGENELSRADVVKRMWEYIKQNDLQDPSDKRKIICDDKLKELFEVDTFNGFSVTKLLTAHFIKTQQ